MTNGFGDLDLLSPREIPGAQAVRVNFDRGIRRFLTHWTSTAGPATLGNVPESYVLRRHFDVAVPYAASVSKATYVETAALADYFRLTPKPLASILHRPDFLGYLTRPLEAVEFRGDAYEPVFSKFEQRIYNLATRYAVADVPFRYEINKRTTWFGDSIVPGPGADGLSPYFGTRRADAVVEAFMNERLRAEAARQGPALAVQVGNVGGHSIYEALEYAINQPLAGETRPRCCIVQARQGFFEDPNPGKPQDHFRMEPHFGVVMAILGDKPGDRPKRLIVLDSQENDVGKAVYAKHFRYGLDRVFPQSPSVFADAGDASVHLVRPAIPKVWRSFDIDCGLYSFAMARALVQIACTRPGVLLFDPSEEIRTQMTARMPEFCDGPGRVKPPAQIRQATVAMRWEMGREALSRMAEAAMPQIQPGSMLRSETRRPARSREDDFAV